MLESSSVARQHEVHAEPVYEIVFPCYESYLLSLSLRLGKPNAQAETTTALQTCWSLGGKHVEKDQSKKN